MKNKGVVFIVQGAMIAALYVVLTMLANALGLSSYSIQIRFSEALCILPFFTPAAIPGLWIGCLIANLMTGAIIWDIIFGSLATLIGAVGTYLLRRHKFACTLPPVIANMVLAFKTPVNILYANTKDLDGVATGEMILQLPEDDVLGDKMIAYLKNTKLTVEELEDYVG